MNRDEIFDLQKNGYPIGARVFHAGKPQALGTVVSELHPSPLNGGPRQEVHWDADTRTSWNPIFLFPEGTPDDDVPDVIYDHPLVFIKGMGTMGISHQVRVITNP